jgi:hypothetical protein
MYQFESKISLDKAKEALETQKNWMDKSNELLNQFGFNRIVFPSYYEFAKAYTQYIHKIRLELPEEEMSTFLISIQNWTKSFFDRNETKFGDVDFFVKNDVIVICKWKDEVPNVYFIKKGIKEIKNM